MAEEKEDLDDLRERLDVVLDSLYASRQPLAAQDELREQFLAVYEDLLDQLQTEDETLEKEHGYLFSIPQHPIYRRLLDDDVLDFVGAGAVYTLPAGKQCEQDDLMGLQEQLESLK